MPFDTDLDAVLEEVAETARPKAAEGEVTDYIDSLAEMDAESFGLAAVEMDGTEHAVGDADQPFAIQSISKVFSLVLALQKADEDGDVADTVWSRVGVEPSGDPFNSLVQLEHEEGKPRNPMINAGALVIDDILLDHCDDATAELRALVSELCGDELTYDENIARQEGDTGGRNKAMAYLMSSFGNLTSPVDEVLDVYVHGCALMMSTRQLARAIRFLGNDGVDPASGKRILSDPLSRRVSAIMLTTGTYDAAGQFAYDVGFPCKSGVAGGIVGVVPHEMGVCVWSPPLAPSGNSAAGHAAFHHLAERLELSLF
jgi:glutaminase